MKEYIYEIGSWQNVTDTIKQHFEIECLTPDLARETMRMYLKGVKVEDMIKQLKEEMK